MAEKTLTDLKTFIDSVNNSKVVRKGKKIQFNFVKRKRK